MTQLSMVQIAQFGAVPGSRITGQVATQNGGYAASLSDRR
jgi:hypothetical protein